MAITVDVTAKLLFDGTYKSTGDLEDATVAISLNESLRFLTSGANAANRWVTDSHQLVATSRNVDFGATLTDAFGNTLNLEGGTIKLIAIYNTATTSGHDLTLSGDLLDSFGSATHQETVHASGWWVRSSPLSGHTVTATTADVLTIDAGGSNTITYEMIVCGQTA